jgi:ceramide glucosyltransferase
MDLLPALVQGVILIPVAVGSVYGVLRLATVALFLLRQRRRPRSVDGDFLPPVALLKPVYGLEKGLEENLRSACLQDYPEFQVVLSVQRSDDPALPLLRRLEQEFGAARVSVAVAAGEPFPNGKVFNLAHAVSAARHEILVISDSDVRLQPDYLRAIVAPLRDPEVGYVCTLYRGIHAEKWFERLELLSLNDLMVNVIFAEATGASGFCLGSSVAFRRSTLDAIGGLEPLGEYLVEDYEMGRRIEQLGLAVALVAHSVDTVVDLAGVRDWWRHQLYLDLNNRMARPLGFFATIVIQPLPFALLFALARLLDPVGLWVLAAALGLRLATAGIAMRLLGERQGPRSLPLLPLRDLVAAATWFLALGMRTVTWRGVRFSLGRDGRMVPVEPSQS